MSLWNDFNRSIRNRVERKIDSWKPPKGEHAMRVKSIEAVYLVVVVFAMLIALSMVAGSGLAVIIVMGATLAAVSERFAQPAAIRMIYDVLAPKLGWPRWELGVQMDKMKTEEEARQIAAYLPFPLTSQGENPVSKVAPDPSVLGTDAIGQKALSIWASLPKERRRERALDVARYLTLNAHHPMLDLIESAEEDTRPGVAETILSSLAKDHHLQLAS